MLRAVCGLGPLFRRSPVLSSARRAFYTSLRALSTLNGARPFQSLPRPYTHVFPPALSLSTRSMMSSAHQDPELGSTLGPFDLKHRVKLDYTDVVVSKWQSRESGLTVVHLDYDGMLCGTF